MKLNDVIDQIEHKKDMASKSCYQFLYTLEYDLWNKMNVSAFSDSSDNGIVSIYFDRTNRINFYSDGVMRFDGKEYNKNKWGREQIYHAIKVSLGIEKEKQSKYEDAELYILEFGRHE